MNFMQGTLDVLILTALLREPRHGYDIVEWIREVTHDTLQIDDGALYTALHRMEKRGWLEAEWRVSPKGRRAKYYRLTREGRQERRAAESNWGRFSEAVGRVIAANQEA